MARGIFVTFEGPDGSGKTTQAHLLVAWLKEMGVEVLHTREPGGTDLGSRIRRLVLDPTGTPVSPKTEMLLMAADRAQHVEETIKPALESGTWVVCERYVDSSIAYQGYGLEQNISEIRRVNEIATSGLTPHLTFVLDVDAETGLAQVSRRATSTVGESGGKDRIENRGSEFQNRVRTGYQELLKEAPERVSWIDVTAREMDDVHSEIKHVVKERYLASLD